MLLYQNGLRYFALFYEKMIVCPVRPESEQQFHETGTSEDIE